MKRVIIIDDDEFYAVLVAKIFGQRHWLPVVCHNMEDALKEIEALRVDLIVTDIFMPGIGGIAGIELLKTQAPGVPVIAMSGGWDKLSPKAAIKAAIKIGASDGLAKPIKNAQLDAALKKLGLDETDIGEPDWPKTANETTDWDVVFDAPVNGLIAWISHAETFEILKTSAFNMLDHLFQNTRTEVNASKYKARLLEIVARGDAKNQAATLDAIVMLLSEIKAQFKQEDARHLAARNLEQFEKNKARRRHNAAASGRKAPLKIYIILAGGFFLLVAAILVFGMGESDEKEQAKPTIEKERKFQTRAKMGKTSVEREVDATQLGPNSSKVHATFPPAPAPARQLALKPDIWEPPEQSFEPPKDAPPGMPPMLALAAIEWSPTPFTPRPAPVYVVPLLNMRSFESMAVICDRAPKVIDMLNVSLSKIPDDGNNPTAAELTQATAPLAGLINAFLDVELVKNVSFVAGPDIGKILFINDPCRPLTPQEIQSLELPLLQGSEAKPPL